jgi:hypothetical protein
MMVAWVVAGNNSAREEGSRVEIKGKVTVGRLLLGLFYIYII